MFRGIDVTSLRRVTLLLDDNVERQVQLVDLALHAP